MILGLGLDVIETAIERHGLRFLERIFLESEMEYCQSMKSPAPHFAARFAAKEAISKAFGTGIGTALGWRDMEVLRGSAGEPSVRLHGKGASLASHRGVARVMLSLTHHQTTAAAVAILLPKA
jgi:holo-[acyl-carrier protein] synthase